MLLCRCEDMTPLQQVQMFSAGLGEPLRTNVELATPADLQTAMSLARTYERRLATATHDLESITSPEPKTAPSSATVAPAASTTPQPHLRRCYQRNWPPSGPTVSATTVRRSTSTTTSASPRVCSCLSWATAEILEQRPQT
jgi:hypothetical protein